MNIDNSRVVKGVNVVYAAAPGYVRIFTAADRQAQFLGQRPKPRLRAIETPLQLTGKVRYANDGVDELFVEVHGKVGGFEEDFYMPLSELKLAN